MALFSSTTAQPSIPHSEPWGSERTEHPADRWGMWASSSPQDHLVTCLLSASGMLHVHPLLLTCPKETQPCSAASSSVLLCPNQLLTTAGLGGMAPQVPTGISWSCLSSLLVPILLKIWLCRPVSLLPVLLNPSLVPPIDELASQPFPSQRSAWY